MSSVPERCPYCGLPVVLADSALVYHGKSYGPIYMCSGWPNCTARVGCHPGTTTPLGTLANDELRWARRLAHRGFDRLWKSGLMTRGEAYVRLAQFLGVPEAHIGESDLAACRRVIAFCRIYSEGMEDDDGITS